MAPTDPLVSVDQVTRKFPLDHSAVTALDHVSLRIDAGEFLAISGPSGSGKSTLLNLIGCIDKPTSGRILIDGVDTSRLSPSQTSALRREKIGFVFQTFNLIPVFTAAKTSNTRCSFRASMPASAASASPKRSKTSASLPARSNGPTCSPAESASALPSPAPSSIVPPWSWPTNRPPTSTPTTPLNSST